jgi:hypothetical protein
MPIAQRFPGVIGGAAFGLVFVLANAHAPLGRDAALVLRLAALDGLATLIVLSIRASRSQALAGRAAAANRRPTTWFGRSSWEVVAGEIAFLIIALQALRAFGAPTQANVALIAFVVGLYSVGAGVVRKQPSIALTGAAVVLLGVAGLALTATAARDWVPLVSGVLPGLILVAGSLFSLVRAHP